MSLCFLSMQTLRGTRVVMDPGTYRQVAEAYIAARRTPARRPHTHPGIPGSDLVCDSPQDSQLVSNNTAISHLHFSQRIFNYRSRLYGVIYSQTNIINDHALSYRVAEDCRIRRLSSLPAAHPRPQMGPRPALRQTSTPRNLPRFTQQRSPSREIATARRRRSVSIIRMI